VRQRALRGPDPPNRREDVERNHVFLPPHVLALLDHDSPRLVDVSKVIVDLGLDAEWADTWGVRANKRQSSPCKAVRHVRKTAHPLLPISTQTLKANSKSSPDVIPSIYRKKWVDPAFDVLYVTDVRYEKEGGFMKRTCEERAKEEHSGA